MAKQDTIREFIKTQIDTYATSIKKIGEYPDDVMAKIGHNFPSVMVGDGDEIWLSTSGDREEVQLSLPIYVYHNVRNSRLTNVNDTTVAVIKAVLKDLTQNSNAINTTIESVEKGTYSDGGGEDIWYEPGFYPDLTIRKINFIITYYDTRSC